MKRRGRVEKPPTEREGRSCARRWARKTHGHSVGQKAGVKLSAEYRAWRNMKQRCLNPDREGYARYGGRGIKVCERWLNSFENFLADVGPRPSPAHSLDRIDNDGDYEPGNVRWATPREQSRNQGRTTHLTVGDEIAPLREWAERTGLRRETICGRLKLGWSHEEALLTPVRVRR